MMTGAPVKLSIVYVSLLVSGWGAQSYAADPVMPPITPPPGVSNPGAPSNSPPPAPALIDDDSDEVGTDHDMHRGGGSPSRPSRHDDDADRGMPEDIAPFAGGAGGKAAKPGARGADAVAEGRDLVSMDFPELTEIKDVIKAVAVWTGKNVILDRNVTGKVQLIFPKKVTKEEAYQAFLSALNILGLTTVETGKVIKIMKVRNAVRGNLKTYLGSSWAPRTDEIITQIIPLKYIEARGIQNTLSRIVSSNSMIAYEPTNTLIISDSGYKVRRVLEILELIDVQTQQPKVLIVPVRYADPAGIVKKINELIKPGAGAGRSPQRSSYQSFKLLTDERSNSVIIFGPPRTISDIRTLVKKFDTKVDDPQSQATIHVRPLDYADAKKLAATLSSLTAGAKSANGLRRPPSQLNGGAGDIAAVASLGNDVKITADESTNSLLITGSRNAYDALNVLIRKLDQRRPQVFIAADILDITSDNGFKAGTSIFAGYKDGPGGSQGIIGWEAAGMAPLVIGQAAGAAAGVTTASSIAQSFSNDMTIGVLAGKSVDVPGLGKLTPGGLISLMKTDTNARVVSSPHVLTTTNEDATITSGETLFFKSSQKDAQGVVEGKVEKEPVDVTLNIKPNISHSNYLTLKVELDSNSVASLTTEGIPRLNKRKTKQIVTVKNGQTVVISGMMKASEYETYKKIPLLGDIPILGWLFRNSQIETKNTNLVIFITPHIIHGAADLAAIYQQKMEERDQLFKSIYGSGYKKDKFYQRLPSAENGLYLPTEKDEAEDKALAKFRQESFEANSLGQKEKKPAAPSSEPKEEEFTVPGELDSGGGGGGGGDAPPPPPDDFPEESDGGGGGGGDE